MNYKRKPILTSIQINPNKTRIQIKNIIVIATELRIKERRLILIIAKLKLEILLTII